MRIVDPDKHHRRPALDLYGIPCKINGMPSIEENPGSPQLLLREDSLGYQVNHLARLLAAALRARIEPVGVAPGQFAQLLALFEDDALTQSELCNRVQIDQSTMAHTLKRMERDGLVDRRPDQIDRRRAVITLTPRSRRLQPALIKAASEVNALATQGLTKGEVEAYLGITATLIANVQALGPDAGPDLTPDAPALT